MASFSLPILSSSIRNGIAIAAADIVEIDSEVDASGGCPPVILEIQVKGDMIVNDPGREGVGEICAVKGGSHCV
jgi:hypothetical protein